MRFNNLYIIKPDEFDNIKLEQVINSYDGTVFHEKKLNELVSKYYNTKFYYLVDNIDKIGILSPLHVQKHLFRKNYFLKPLYDIPYGGFIGPNLNNISTLKTGFLDYICYAGTPLQSNQQIKFLKSEKIIWKETFLIDLSNDLETIFNKVIDSKRRNMIRKAWKNGIIVKNVPIAEGLDYFLNLIDELHNKLNYKHLERSFYREILEYYKFKDKAALFLAFKDEILLSGLIVIGNNNLMHYYKGASIKERVNDGQGELLQWEAIKWSKEKGARYYDLCVVNKSRLPDLYRFKAGFSSEIYSFPTLADNGLGYKIASKIQKILI
jgi:hypothetical protein